MAKKPRAGHTQVTVAEEERVTSLELFFDLVFVFTLTQLSARLHESLSWESLLQSSASMCGSMLTISATRTSGLTTSPRGGMSSTGKKSRRGSRGSIVAGLLVGY